MIILIKLVVTETQQKGNPKDHKAVNNGYFIFSLSGPKDPETGLLFRKIKEMDILLKVSFCYYSFGGALSAPKSYNAFCSLSATYFIFTLTRKLLPIIPTSFLPHWLFLSEELLVRKHNHCSV